VLDTRREGREFAIVQHAESNWSPVLRLRLLGGEQGPQRQHQSLVTHHQESKSARGEARIENLLTSCSEQAIEDLTVPRDHLDAIPQFVDGKSANALFTKGQAITSSPLKSPTLEISVVMGGY